MRTRDLLFVVLSLVPAVRVSAAIAVQNNWDLAREMSVEGAGWRALFTKAEAALVFTVNDQSVRIRPLVADTSEPLRCVSCVAAEPDAQGAVDVTVRVAAGGRETRLRFRFAERGALQITPDGAACGVAVRADIAVGVLPGIRLEDVLYYPDKYGGTDKVNVPSENWFAGLLNGNNGMVVCAWPDGNQTCCLRPMSGGFDAIEVFPDGKELFLEVLAGPAIWRREKLELSYLEKDTEMAWQRPFQATYKTQLLMKAETSTVRTFTLWRKRYGQYRPEVGWYEWPVWFEGDRAYLRLGKKIPPRGDAVIYPFDDAERTLMEFLRRTPLAGTMDKRNARAELPYGPRNAPNVGFVACGGTQMLRKTVYALGLQHREKEFLAEYADFLADYVAIVQQKNAAYFSFVDRMRDKLRAWSDAETARPEVQAYLEQMQAFVDRIEESHKEKMEMFGEHTPEQHIAHADRAAARLKELLDTEGPELFPECDELIDTLNTLSWAHDEVTGMRFSMLCREWAQEAALACAANPAALAYAREIRAAIRNALNAAPPW